MRISAIPQRGSVDPPDLLLFPRDEGTASMANSALLVMDVQRDIVGIADDGSGYLPRLRNAIEGARAAGIPVIYVVDETTAGQSGNRARQQGARRRRAGRPVHRG